MNLPALSHPAFEGLFGTARRDITPPLGIYSRNWGAATSDVAVAVHRPLTLTALVMQAQAGEEPVAILSLDLGWWRSLAEEAVLNQAVQAAGIGEGRYLLALSHTHAGPVFCPGDAEKPGGEWISRYLETLSRLIGEAIAEALDSMQPGILETATGSCALASNRDLPFTDERGSRLLVGWNPEVQADETLLIGRVSDRDGKCLAVLVNYACHPTILAWQNNTISPDFVGAMRELVERETQAPCLFLQGASGELAARHQYVGNTDVADRAGRTLGHAVLAIFYGMLEPGMELAFQGAVNSGAPLALWEPRKRQSMPGALEVRSIPIDLEVKHDLPSEEELLGMIESCADRVEGERLQRRLLTRRSVGNGPLYTTTHLLWEVGGIRFISVPNEVYSRLQTELRSASGETPLFVVTLANETRGYLAPVESYRQDSYASRQSPFSEGCLERTVECLAAAITGDR